MKRLLVIMLLLLGLSSCGNRKESVAETIDNLSTVVAQQDTSSVAPLTFVEDSITTYTGTLTEILVDKYAYKIVELSKELKVPAKHVYSVVIKQQTINSVAWLFIYLILAILAFIFFKLRSIENKKDKYSDAIEIYQIFAIIMSAVLLIIILFTFHVVARGLFNPEFGALKTIANFFINL